MEYMECLGDIRGLSLPVMSMSLHRSPRSPRSPVTSPLTEGHISARHVALAFRHKGKGSARREEGRMPGGWRGADV